MTTLGTRISIFSRARRFLRADGRHFDLVLESVSTRPFFAHKEVGERALVLYHQIADDVWDQEFPFPLSFVGRRVIEPHWLRSIRDARVVANSPSTAADLARHSVPTVGVVPPGADWVAAPKVRMVNPVPRVVFIGRLVRTKRPADAIRAFATIRRSFPAASLDVIGDGYLLEELRRLRAPGVTVHGFVPGEIKAAFLARADLLLLPGTREGWGIVALEAGLHGIPTVAYDVPGLRDAVQHGRTGSLTPCDPYALGAAGTAILRDRELWSQYSIAARRWAASFSWQRAADGVLALSLMAPTPEVREPAA